MKPRNIALLSTLPLSMAAAQAQDTAAKPNVLFIIVDDYGWSDVSYNGSTFYETPNIDRLAAEGMVFSSGYAAAPVSSPTRISIMTGKYPARTGFTDWIPGYQFHLSEERLSRYKMISPEPGLNMPLEEVTIGEALSENGTAVRRVLIIPNIRVSTSISEDGSKEVPTANAVSATRAEPTIPPITTRCCRTVLKENFLRIDWVPRRSRLWKIQRTILFS